MFFDHAASVFVIAQPDELRMSEVIAIGPLQKFNLSHEFRATQTHFFMPSTVSPSPQREQRVSGRLTNGHFDTARG